MPCMKRLLNLFVIWVVAVFCATRFLVRVIAFLITPIYLVLSLFSFGISWLLFQCWHLTKPPTTAPTFTETGERCNREWKDWGRCMLEAAFDTITVLIFLAIIGKCIFAAPVIDRFLKHFDNAVLFWILFWGLTLIPFLIRLRTHWSTETDEPNDARKQ